MALESVAHQATQIFLKITNFKQSLCFSRPECKVVMREEEEEVVDSVEIRDDHTMTRQLRAAARNGKGRFLLLTFKEVRESLFCYLHALVSQQFLFGAVVEHARCGYPAYTNKPDIVYG